MPSLHNSDLTAKLLKLIAGGVELSDSDRKNAIKALKALKAQIEKGEDEAPLLLVENCREAGFANLPNKYMGILDKMLGQGSSKYLMGDAKKTFAYDSGSREFVQCVPYKTLELARELDQKKIDKNHDTVGRLLRVLVKFEKSWKKVMHQTNSLTVPLTKNDEYTDENGNLVVKAPLGAGEDAGKAGKIPEKVPLNSCFAAQTAEECDARLDGPYGDPGACLWMPYYQHLEGPDANNTEEKEAWDALKQTACVPKDKVPFPMRKMDDKDFEALTEGKMRKNGDYDERLKMMKPASDADTFSGNEIPATKFGDKRDEAYSLDKIKQEFRLESALLPNGRDAPYFDSAKFNKKKQIEDLFKGAPTKKGMMARTLENQYIRMVATSEQTPQRVKNKMQQSADRYKQISEKILNQLDADTILKEMKTNEKTGNYEWEDKVDRNVYPDFVPILERYARAVYELAKAGELSQDDITKIVSRGSADRDQRSLLVTKRGKDCESVLTKLVQVNGKPMPDKQQPIMEIKDLEKTGSDVGFVQRKTGTQKALFDNNGNQLVPVYQSKDQTLDQVIGAVNKEELFVVLRGGGDPFAYNMQQLRAGGSGSVYQNLAGLGDNLKVERDWNDAKKAPKLKKENLKDKLKNNDVCLHRVDIGVVMVLKGNYDKYMPMVAAAYDAAGSTATAKAAEEEIIATAKKLRGTTEAHRCLNYLYLTMVHPTVKDDELPEGWGNKEDYDKFITKSTMYRLPRGNDYYEKRLDENGNAVVAKTKDNVKFSRPITYKRNNEAIVPMILTKHMRGGECTSKCDTIPGLVALDEAQRRHVEFYPNAEEMENKKIEYEGKLIGTYSTPDRAQILYLRTRGFDLATEDNKKAKNAIESDKADVNNEPYLAYDNIHYNDNNELSVGDGRPKEAPTMYGYEKQTNGQYKQSDIPMRHGLTLKELHDIIMQGKVATGIHKDNKENFMKTMAILEKLQAHISGAPCNELNITQFGWVRD